ncbi:hypothetical protein IH799_09350 [candidate division KSB1 bacterium]|nr:hypothetical protein [candidate division KSB1 bacterium]
MFLVKKNHRVQSLRATPSPVLRAGSGSEAISLLNIGRLLRRFIPRKDGLFLIAVTFLISITAPALHACPGCGAALNGEISHGFNLSVLYMMAMPFIVFGGVAIGIVYVTRQSQSQTKTKLNQISIVKKEEEN